jgi:diguanylate cyclase (GGDEF)-like protein
MTFPVEASAKSLAAQYRRASAFLIAAVLFLTGTAVYLGLRAKDAIWLQAREGLENIALGLESSTTAQVQQSVASLQGIKTDIESRTTLTHDELLAILRNAMRFDPVSSHLGVLQSGSAGLVAVNQTGVEVASADLPMLRAAVPARLGPSAGGLRLHPLVRSASLKDWLLPITLSDTKARLVLAFVPTKMLMSGTDTLRLLSGSSMSLVGLDGQRFLRFYKDHDELEVNGPSVSTQVFSQLRGQRTGNDELFNDATGSTYLYGFTTSRSLPLYVTAAIPTAQLYRRLTQELVGPLFGLSIGLSAVLIFWVLLKRTLNRYQANLERQMYLAQHDSLTGLLNRDAFLRHLDVEIETAADVPFSVTLMDISNFKDINDTLGHEAGDDVLRRVGQRMLSLDGANEHLCIARLGGDELAVFARHIQTYDALHELTQKVSQILGAPLDIGAVKLELASSMGAAVYPHDAKTSQELLRCADIALYAGKADMRPFSRYMPTMDRFTPEMLTMKAELATAIRERALSLVYQPKVRLTDSALVGVETLSRWAHPAKGAICPSQFVPLVESMELIHPFTYYVLHQALAQARQWHQTGHWLPVAVNISANNLLDPAFIDRVGELLKEQDLPAELLELEVTESALMRHPETVLKRLQALRELGVKLAIDDFGAGYASLAYLKQLPVHTLKIDKSFVANLSYDDGDQRIVRSSIQLGHGFGMSVVAEGVETAESASLLRDYGCDHAQGFYYCVPLQEEDLRTQWLRPPIDLDGSTHARLRAGPSLPSF